MYFSSQSTRGFCSPKLTTPMPEDALEIPDDLYEELITGEAGKVIFWSGTGLPFLKDMQATPEAINASILIDRAAAYRRESDPIFFQFQRGEVNEQDWHNKISEIKTRLPKV